MILMIPFLGAATIVYGNGLYFRLLTTDSTSNLSMKLTIVSLRNTPAIKAASPWEPCLVDFVTQVQASPWWGCLGVPDGRGGVSLTSMNS
jgi:hypothetical protein